MGQKTRVFCQIDVQEFHLWAILQHRLAWSDLGIKGQEYKVKMSCKPQGWDRLMVCISGHTALRCQPF
jgi:hypothetical protein